MENQGTKVTLVRRKALNSSEINISRFSDNHLDQLKQLLKSDDGIFRVKYDEAGFGTEQYIAMSPVNAKYNGSYIKLQ